MFLLLDIAVDGIFRNMTDGAAEVTSCPQGRNSALQPGKLFSQQP
jgi:hypothetical protein